MKNGFFEPYDPDYKVSDSWLGNTYGNFEKVNQEIYYFESDTTPTDIFMIFMKESFAIKEKGNNYSDLKVKFNSFYKEDLPEEASLLDHLLKRTNENFINKNIVRAGK